MQEAEHFEKKLEDEMANPEIKRMLEDGIAGEGALYELHKKQQGEVMEATEHIQLMFAGGAYHDVIMWLDDEEHAEQVKEFFGEKDWSRFLELREMYMKASMPPAEWMQSQEKKELDIIVVRAYRRFRDSIRMIPSVPDPKTFH